MLRGAERSTSAYPPSEAAVHKVLRVWESSMAPMVRANHLLRTTQPERRRIDSAHGVNPCELFAWVARLCEAPGRDPRKMLADLRDGGVADLSAHLAGQWTIRKLAKTLEDDAAADDGLSESRGRGPQLALLARLLRILGVHACVQRRAVASCACLSALEAEPLYLEASDGSGPGFLVAG